MNIIVMITQKGGTGKTALALNLAVAAVERGKKPLIIDVDMQASAGIWACGGPRKLDMRLGIA